MKKIYDDNLIRHKNGGIDWGENIGKSVDFQYDSIKGAVIIMNYESKNNKLTIKYNNKVFKIATQSFKKCSFGEILKVKTTDYKYNIGDIINNMLILEQKRLKYSNKKNRHGKQVYEKAYKYKCLKCSYIGENFETRLSTGVSCQCCTNRIIQKGINDIATTHPHLVKYFVNIEDTYKCSYGINKKYLMKCPICCSVREYTPNDLSNKGFACKQCGKGVSFSERVLNNILKQCDIKFKQNTEFKWSDRKKYDFYIPNKRCIIETHGIQHYDGTFCSMGGRDLKAEQENDAYKRKMALSNGIKYYIELDCRKSNLEWIKNSALKSKLAELFDLSNIDWGLCEKESCDNVMLKVIELWNSGIRSTKDIYEMNVGVCRGTIISYLNKGYELGLCDYKGNKNRMTDRKS